MYGQRIRTDRKPTKTNNKLVGYARVSTDDQNLDLQVKALMDAGCQVIFKDKGVPGSRMKRPGLRKAIRAARGGTLVVWRLDRLGRSLQGLVKLMGNLAEQDTSFHSLNEAIDTRSSAGVLFFHIMAALSEFERSLISERTKAGLEAARSRGACLGRPRALTGEQVSQALAEIEGNNSSLTQLCKDYGVSERTMKRYLDEYRNIASMEKNL